jgi:cell division protein FtsL
MIARRLPRREDSSRVAPAGPAAPGGTRAGRAASVLRRGRSQRSRYRSVGRIAVLASIVTAALIVYLFLLANVTRMNDEASAARLQLAGLKDQVRRSDDEIARLSSRERLAALADRLGMKEPAAYRVVRLPKPEVARSPDHISLLSSIAGWGR